MKTRGSKATSWSRFGTETVGFNRGCLLSSSQRGGQVSGHHHWLQTELKAQNHSSVQEEVSRLQFLRSFYQSVVTRSFLCVSLGRQHWSGNVKRLSKVIKKIGTLFGCNLDSFTVVAKRRTLNRLSIMENTIMENNTMKNTIKGSQFYNSVSLIILVPHSLAVSCYLFYQTFTFTYNLHLI